MIDNLQVTVGMNSHAGIEPIAVRISTAIELTGICRTVIYELIKSGDLKVVKIGRSTFIVYASLKALFYTEHDESNKS